MRGGRAVAAAPPPAHVMAAIWLRHDLSRAAQGIMLGILLVSGLGLPLLAALLYTILAPCCTRGYINIGVRHPPRAACTRDAAAIRARAALCSMSHCPRNYV